MVILHVLIYWSNIHNTVAAHSVIINRNHYSKNDNKMLDNKLLKRQKRVIVFRPLFVYKQQQKEKQEKQKMREKWKVQQQHQQQQYQSNYQQQYYQQYLQNYYNQFPSSGGLYQHYNQPNYPYPHADQYSNVGNEQSNNWNYNNGEYNNYFTPHQHTSSCYSPTKSSHNPNQYYNSLSSDYYYD